MIKTTCKQCKKEFQYNYTSRKRTFCSIPCADESRRFYKNASEEEKLENLKIRFEKFVIKNEIGCWGWKGSLTNKGYGILGFGSHGHISVHRASWLIHKGKIPEGLCVLHSCDRPTCTKITESDTHLFLGTQLENIVDRVQKGRTVARNGERCTFTKLNEKQVLEIRKLIDINMPLRQIAKKYNTCRANVRLIQKRLTWKHLGE
jgi:hypothetical protein